MYNRLGWLEGLPRHTANVHASFHTGMFIWNGASSLRGIHIMLLLLCYDGAKKGGWVETEIEDSRNTHRIRDTRWNWVTYTREIFTSDRRPLYLLARVFRANTNSDLRPPAYSSSRFLRHSSFDKVNIRSTFRRNTLVYSRLIRWICLLENIDVAFNRRIFYRSRKLVTPRLKTCASLPWRVRKNAIFQ